MTEVWFATSSPVLAEKLVVSAKQVPSFHDFGNGDVNVDANDHDVRDTKFIGEGRPITTPQQDNPASSLALFLMFSNIHWLMISIDYSLHRFDIYLNYQLFFNLI